MKAHHLVFLSLLAALPAANAFAGTHKSAGSPKVFLGATGESIAILPLDDRKKMLILARGTEGVFHDQALVYDLEDEPAGDFVAGFANFPNHPAHYSMKMILSRQKEAWTYYDCLDEACKKTRPVTLTFSEADTKKAKAKTLLAGTKDFQPPWAAKGKKTTAQ